MFKMEVETGNAAFEWEGEILRILKDVVSKIEAGCYSGSVFDVNGNKCGSYEYDNRDALGLLQESEG